LKASFDSALTETLKADFTLSTSNFMPFSPDVARRVDELSEVGAVAAFRNDQFSVNGATTFLTAVDTTTVEEVASMEVSEGSLSALTGDTIMVHRALAQEKGWAMGTRSRRRSRRSASAHSPSSASSTRTASSATT
jgi:putative ABC transport system permease protein